MSDFAHIDIHKTQELLLANKATLVDIRDQQSYSQAHIPEAIHLSNHNLHTFIQNADLDKALIVVCYHGNSSQAAAQVLAQQGFAEVYSMDGGFAAWLQHFPDQIR